MLQLSLWHGKAPSLQLFPNRSLLVNIKLDVVLESQGKANYLWTLMCTVVDSPAKMLELCAYSTSMGLVCPFCNPLPKLPRPK